MKKRLLLIASILFMAFGLSAQEFNVNFDYSMSVKSGKGSSGDEPSVVKVVSEGNKCSVTIPKFYMSEDRCVNSYKIEGVEYVKNGDVIELKGSNLTSNDGKNDIIIYDLKGKIENGKLDLTVLIKVGKMPFKLTVHYYSK